MEILGLTLPSYGWSTIFGSAISGVFLGSIYALVALGLTLIYGVLHIINFAHGALLMLAMPHRIPASQSLAHSQSHPRNLQSTESVELA